MAGLVPAIHVLLTWRMAGGFVYMMSDHRDGILYVGVTSYLPKRAMSIDPSHYGIYKAIWLKRLVWFEQHDDIRGAIQRETLMKHWPRAWKVRLINAVNSEWRDLYDEIV